MARVSLFEVSPRRKPRSSSGRGCSRSRIDCESRERVEHEEARRNVSVEALRLGISPAGSLSGVPGNFFLRCHAFRTTRTYFFGSNS